MIYATSWAVFEYLKGQGQKAGTKLEALTEIAFRGFCERASRRFDTMTKRHFYPKREVRYYDHPGVGTGGFYQAAPPSPGNFPYVNQSTVWLDNDLPLDEDLLALEALVTNNGNTTIQSSDILLMTGNTYNYPPYDHIRLVMNGQQTVFLFSGTPQKANAVTGQWGYHESFSSAFPALDLVQNDPLLIGATSVSVADASGPDENGISPRFQTQQMIRFSSGTSAEYAMITGVDYDNNTLTVVRAQAGTVAQEWAMETIIYIYRPMSQIVDALLTLAAHLWRRKDSIGTFEDRGMASSTGVLVLPPKLPIEVNDMIMAYKRPLPGK